METAGWMRPGAQHRRDHDDDELTASAACPTVTAKDVPAPVRRARRRNLLSPPAPVGAFRQFPTPLFV